ncbi:MAG TPA: hypothetical protein VEF03_01260 [Candidatus Binataceae bacterium]|nr:hypothetical protein [Candidatus Binataceae bacterium]
MRKFGAAVLAIVMLLGWSGAGCLAAVPQVTSEKECCATMCSKHQIPMPAHSKCCKVSHRADTAETNPANNTGPENVRIASSTTAALYTLSIERHFAAASLQGSPPGDPPSRALLCSRQI